jgi:hypothetical protein
MYAHAVRAKAYEAILIKTQECRLSFEDTQDEQVKEEDRLPYGKRVDVSDPVTRCSTQTINSAPIPGWPVTTMPEAVPLFIPVLLSDSN